MRVACALVLLLLAVPAPAAEPLRLADVLATSAMRFPAILAERAERDAAAGEIGIAAGAFDTLVDASSDSYASGFYDGQVVRSTVRQPLRRFGASLYGEYQISDGDFPIYEDENFTNRGGKAKVGVVLSLLRDRDIDDRRFATEDAALGLEQAELDVLLTQIAVQRDAAVAYWRWVAAGQRLAVYEDLLANAEDRDAGLVREVASGARAAIFLTENRQTITQRRSLVAQSERDFLLAANRLAFYLRDADGRPLLPTRDRVPDAMEPPPATAPRALQSAATVLLNRPELRQLETRIRRAGNRLRLRENLLKPRFDVSVSVAEGIGGVGEGGVSRDSTDTVIGLNFSVPIQQRTARGRVAQAEAELEALRRQRQLAEERIALELEAIVMGLNYAEQLASLASTEVEQSQRLEEAEITRFS